MKYSELLNFNPIDSVIALTAANDLTKEEKLVNSYVMSKGMADKLKYNMISQLRLDEVYDNKGVLLVGNYGTGKSHLMSVISAIARDEKYLSNLQNKEFAEEAKIIAGKFETLRIEIGASQMSLRDIIFTKITEDFTSRGLSIKFKPANEVTENKSSLIHMMQIIESKYGDKGYLICVDEFLDYLGSRKEHEVNADLMFLREMGEVVKQTKLRIIFGVQEKLFDNPRFQFVADTLKKVKDRFEQVIIMKEDTAYVVSERILKKNDHQKSIIREHLQKFCSLYSNMNERLEEYVDMYPIHPAFIDAFNKIYIAENRQILKSISEIIKKIIDTDFNDDVPGVISFDYYWEAISQNMAYRTDPNIKEVVEKSKTLTDIIDHSFTKKIYKPTALKIINALSVYRLTTNGDITIKQGLTPENLKDDLCLYLPFLPDQTSETLLSTVYVVMKEIMSTVSGQFIEKNEVNNQYYLDLKKDIDYDEQIKNQAAIIDDSTLNNYYFNIIYSCMDWNKIEHVTNFRIYQHSINWNSHNMYRNGYLFLGTPNNRPTAQPPEDYYIYFLPPFGCEPYNDENKDDEVFFRLKADTDSFKENLKYYAAAEKQKSLADDSNKPIYQKKAEEFKKKLCKQINENKNTWFDVIYKGNISSMLAIQGAKYSPINPFKDTFELVASLCFDAMFNSKYPEYPKFSRRLTNNNFESSIKDTLKVFTNNYHSEYVDSILNALGLLTGQDITVDTSKYAQRIIEKVDQLNINQVINFSDLFEHRNNTAIDKEFKIENELYIVILIALVYNGNIVLKSNGKSIEVGNINEVNTINVSDLAAFQYISKPKGIKLDILIELFKTVGLSPALITSEANRNTGLGQLIQKAEEYNREAVLAENKLSTLGDLWDSSLITNVNKQKYLNSLTVVKSIFGNFNARFNTIAKLANFDYSINDISNLKDGIKAINIINEYKLFYDKVNSDISYISSVENVSELKDKIASAKIKFEAVKDTIVDELDGDAAANDLLPVLENVKNDYINIYTQKHNAKRVTGQALIKKNEIENSQALANILKLTELPLFDYSEYEKIKSELNSIKSCNGIDIMSLHVSCNCNKCGYVLTNFEPDVTGRLDSLEERIETILSSWNDLLYNTLSDELLKDQMQYLNALQKATIDSYLTRKQLPEKVDYNFNDAVKALLNGFVPVEISIEELSKYLTAKGVLDPETFVSSVNNFVTNRYSGKDPKKVRIILKK